VASKEKKNSVKVTISQWCLDVLVSQPSQDEIDDVVQYIKDHHDVARLRDVAVLATFALMVRYPATGARQFGNDEIAMLANRAPDALLNTLDALHEVTSKVCLQVQDSLAAKPAAKIPTKKVK